MSTAPTPQRRLTPEEYLAIERASEFRSEFYDGRMYAIAGSSARHNLITANIAGFLRDACRPRRCKVFLIDMRVRISTTGLYTYPDVAVACNDIQFGDSTQDTLMNPCVIVEVLSKSTASRDRGWKLQNYCKIPSLIDYVLVSQDRPFVEHFVRRPEGNWMFEFMEGLDFSLKLAAIELTIPLREIYLDVQFGPEEGDELA